jgi:NAD(P)-dependent dehydrogenase (short-subunit alcohol dehydrogenase family)
VKAGGIVVAKTFAKLIIGIAALAADGLAYLGAIWPLLILIMRNFGRRLPELQEGAARHKNIHSQTANVTDAESLQRLYHDAQTARGSFGIVVANVGAAGFGRAVRFELDHPQGPDREGPSQQDLLRPF